MSEPPRKSKALGADHIIVAAPVVSPQTHKKLLEHCDDVVALRMPFNFSAVGQFYVNFKQTSDAEIVSDLRDSCKFASALSKEWHASQTSLNSRSAEAPSRSATNSSIGASGNEGA